MPASAGRGRHPAAAVPSADLDDLLAHRPGAPGAYYGAKPTRGGGRGRGILPAQASAPEADDAATGDVIAPEPSRGRGRPAAGAAERPRTRLPVEQAGLLSVERSAGRGAALKGAFERARAAFYEAADASTADDDEPQLDGPRSRRDWPRREGGRPAPSPRAGGSGELKLRPPQPRGASPRKQRRSSRSRREEEEDSDWADDDDDWEEGRFDDAVEEEGVVGGLDRIPIDPTSADEMEQARPRCEPRHGRRHHRRPPPRPLRSCIFT